MQTHTPTSLSAVWRRIDRIQCITLTDRLDRQASVRAQFARAGLDGQVAFFFARRHSENAEQGIFESHQACLKAGLAAGARHLLVFEDDVVFGSIDARRLSAGIDFFLGQAACPILFLGGLVDDSGPTTSAAVRRVRYRCLAHAYLIKAPLARQVAAQPWREIPYDNLLGRITADHFALYPSIAFQSRSPSDNSRHRALDTVRRMFGGLGVIQRANERFHRHRPAVVLAHLLAIGALILWMVNR